METGLGLGANEGDRIGNLRAAKAAIAALPGVTLVAQSSLYETEPVGVKPEYQHMKFINAVLVVRSELTLDTLHQRLAAIETAIGRRRSGDRFAPRPLDIDLLYAGSLVVNTPTLKLPHPQCLKRRFVLAPLTEINPQLILPSMHVTVKELLDGLATPEQVVRLPDIW